MTYINAEFSKEKSEGKAILGLTFLTLNLEVFKKAKRRTKEKVHEPREAYWKDLSRAAPKQAAKQSVQILISCLKPCVLITDIVGLDFPLAYTW